MSKRVKPFLVPHEKVVYKDDASSIAYKSDIDKLKQLREKFQKMLCFSI